MTNYKKEYGLSDTDIEYIDANIAKANKTLAILERKPNKIKDNCESDAIKAYLNSL
ncbi:hypothetical protein [uncultured Gammaproteobacteria bacterium]|jgi:5-bromo-4-chloroindolyl phosphate hydrolysis protein|nr:hypothetical protein BROOK1789C_1390 [Bathymodiolus brooksi thiotrophic gill symbiont]CAC9552450.1 hypothetical protein [uncultured Gammaproteobacteria bacterium]CAC9558627.1 hypothetical protein [uncultured Gammaproteobacteria bacterium]CAC9567235.1 hypothetical protein [uncultured Gammaproteobacteria bacterium]CAC9589502.1 hypothetical protein [uncultured Gammaproteobacteria bacterium]